MGTKDDIIRAVERANAMVEHPRCQLPLQRVRDAISGRIVSTSAVVVANPAEVRIGRKRLKTVQLRLYEDGLWWVGLVAGRGKYKEELCGYGRSERGGYVAMHDGVVLCEVRAIDAEHARLLLWLDWVDIVSARSRR
jgi:hypothetical protein